MSSKRRRGRVQITDLSVLHGDFWPEEESIEDFAAGLCTTPIASRCAEIRCDYNRGKTGT